MTDQGPNEDNGAGSSELVEASEQGRGRPSKPVSVDLEQLSFLSIMEGGMVSELVERIQVNPVLTIETGEVTGNDELADVDGRSADIEHVRLMKRFPSLQPFQSNRPGTARARLVYMLNDCLMAGQVPRGIDNAKINRKHFSKKMGVSAASVVLQADVLAAYEAVLGELEPLANEYTRFGAKITKEREGLLREDTHMVLARYPQLHKHQFYPVESNAGRLVGLLNGQIVSGNIERSRGGKLNRLWLIERLGVAYLVYLAWDAWRDSTRSDDVPDRPAARFFVRGLTTNLLNAKAAVFYIAVLPTFLDPAFHPAGQAVILSAIYVLVATTVHATIVTLASFLRPMLTHKRMTAIAGKFFALALIGVALWIAWSTR